MQAFAVVADPVRRRILELLATGEHASGEIVTVVQGDFSITQAAVSQHLRVLRDNGFATVRAQGARRLYSVDTAGFGEVEAWLEGIRRQWNQRLDALGTEIARGKRKRRRS